jgi:sulfatase maturation enzyme AslB (radical SAM superfamily)
MRIRQDETANYRAIFFDGKTIRSRLNSDLPFSTPSFPEIEDVAINNKCFANCSYCYTSALKTGTNFENIIDKAQSVWENIPEAQRPFQIAIGGAGESTIHPQFAEFVKAVKELKIVPNYTTNGMHLSDEVIKATSEYCGGVALSYHPHLTGTFDKAMFKLGELAPHIKLNTHIILGDDQSFNDLTKIYDQYNEQLDYLVILPYQAAGRGTPLETHTTWVKTFNWIASLDPEKQKKFAFGALFYEWMKNNKVPLKMSLYEPEIFSGYRIMDESFEILRKSSYDLTPKYND